MTKKIFLDTNFWIRFAVVDSKLRYQSILELIKLIESGKFLPYTSAVVLLEVTFVLDKIYRKENAEINKFIDKILITRNLTVVNQTDFTTAFNWHKLYKLKLADCLIASSLSRDMTLITWDCDFRKLTFVNNLTPESLLIKVRQIKN